MPEITSIIKDISDNFMIIIRENKNLPRIQKTFLLSNLVNLLQSCHNIRDTKICNTMINDMKIGCLIMVIRLLDYKKNTSKKIINQFERIANDKRYKESEKLTQYLYNNKIFSKLSRSNPKKSKKIVEINSKGGSRGTRRTTRFGPRRLSHELPQLTAEEKAALAADEHRNLGASQNSAESNNTSTRGSSNRNSSNEEPNILPRVVITVINDLTRERDLTLQQFLKQVETFYTGDFNIGGIMTRDQFNQYLHNKPMNNFRHSYKTVLLAMRGLYDNDARITNKLIGIVIAYINNLTFSIDGIDGGVHTTGQVENLRRELEKYRNNKRITQSTYTRITSLTAVQLTTIFLGSGANTETIARMISLLEALYTLGPVVPVVPVAPVVQAVPASSSGFLGGLLSIPSSMNLFLVMIILGMVGYLVVFCSEAIKSVFGVFGGWSSSVYNTLRHKEDAELELEKEQQKTAAEAELANMRKKLANSITAQKEAEIKILNVEKDKEKELNNLKEELSKNYKADLERKEKEIEAEFSKSQNTELSEGLIELKKLMKQSEKNINEMCDEVIEQWNELEERSKKELKKEYNGMDENTFKKKYNIPAGTNYVFKNELVLTQKLVLQKMHELDTDFFDAEFSYSVEHHKKNKPIPQTSKSSKSCIAYRDLKKKTRLLMATLTQSSAKKMDAAFLQLNEAQEARRVREGKLELSKQQHKAIEAAISAEKSVKQLAKKAAKEGLVLIKGGPEVGITAVPLGGLKNACDQEILGLSYLPKDMAKDVAKIGGACMNEQSEFLLLGSKNIAPTPEKINIISTNQTLGIQGRGAKGKKTKHNQHKKTKHKKTKHNQHKKTKRKKTK
jgi:hypothetical protein